MTLDIYDILGKIVTYFVIGIILLDQIPVLLNISMLRIVNIKMTDFGYEKLFPDFS